MKFNKNRDKKEVEIKSTVTFSAAQYAGITTQKEVMATEEMRKGMALLKEAMHQDGRKVCIKQGNFFEYIEAAKFNTESARKGSFSRARVTDAMGRHTDPADVEIFDRITGKVKKEIQYKSSSNPKWLADQISDPKYRNMQCVVSKEHYDDVVGILQKRALKGDVNAENTLKIMSNGTNDGRASTKGTKNFESTKAAQNPETYSAMMNTKQCLREVGITTGQAALGGAIIGGTIAAIKNGIMASNGQMTSEDAITATAKETGKSGFKAGISGGLGSFIRQGVKNTGAKIFAKPNVATAVAAATIETGVVVYDWVKGEITSEEAITKVGQNTTSTLSGLYVGAASGAVFGPAGAVIGSIAGFMLTSNIYQSCVAIFENARLSEIETARLIALYEDAAAEMKRQRQEFEKYVGDVLKEKHNAFAQSFELIDKGLYYNSPEVTTYALTQLADLVGVKLKLGNFDDFNEFMVRSSSPLTL